MARNKGRKTRNIGSKEPALCLKCQKTFMSENKRYNRICGRCSSNPFNSGNIRIMTIPSERKGLDT